MGPLRAAPGSTWHSCVPPRARGRGGGLQRPGSVPLTLATDSCLPLTLATDSCCLSLASTLLLLVIAPSPFRLPTHRPCQSEGAERSFAVPGCVAWLKWRSTARIDVVLTLLAVRCSLSSPFSLCIYIYMRVATRWLPSDPPAIDPAARPRRVEISLSPFRPPPSPRSLAVAPLNRQPQAVRSQVRTSRLLTVL